MGEVSGVSKTLGVSTVNKVTARFNTIVGHFFNGVKNVLILLPWYHPCVHGPQHSNLTTHACFFKSLFAKTALKMKLYILA